jgi:hypothetical protein
MDKKLESLKKIKQFMRHVYEYDYETEEANFLAAHIYTRVVRYMGDCLNDEDC